MLEFIIALAASALAGMGVGGGGLLVIYLTLVKDTEQLAAQGINLAFFLAGALPAIAVHICKRHINYPLAITLGLLGAAGSLCGTALAGVLGGALLQKAFGALLALTGVRALFAKDKK